MKARDRAGFVLEEFAVSTWDDKPNNYEHALAEIERLRVLLAQINARARTIPDDDLKELQRQMLHIVALSQ